MKSPVLSVLMITVRPDQAYPAHPDWHVIGHALENLQTQTLRPEAFELVVVDGLYEYRKEAVAEMARGCSFRVVHVPPLKNLWTENKKAAICTYRNTGLLHVQGELIVNLDDTFVLPEDYLSYFHDSWKGYNICLAATWIRRGDRRIRPAVKMRQVTVPGEVYGFGSYPLQAALELNGYDLAFDGSQGLEDSQWSTRLFWHGVRSWLINLDGFNIPEQSLHDPRAINPKEPLARCCNQSWQVQCVERRVSIANKQELWTGPQGRTALERLAGGPCAYINREGRCRHHDFAATCAYLTDCLFDNGTKSFARERHPLATRLLQEPPVFDLKEERRKVQALKNEDEA